MNASVALCINIVYAYRDLKSPIEDFTNPDFKFHLIRNSMHLRDFSRIIQ